MFPGANGSTVTHRFSDKLLISILFISLTLLVFLYWLHDPHKLAGTESRTQLEFVRLFDLNGEGNIPAWFSSFLFILAAYSGVELGREDRGNAGRIPMRIGWRAMAGVFLFLSLDETAGLHEAIGRYFSIFADGLPIYAWTFFGAAFAALVGLMFLPFFLRLPAVTRTGLALSGLVFLGGAVGVESIGAIVDIRGWDHAPRGFSWTRAIALEEGMEMAGVIMLIATLRHYRRMLAKRH